MIHLRVKDAASGALRGVSARFAQGRPLMTMLGKALQALLRDYFLKRGTHGNKRGWPSQHFWDRRVRNATVFAGADDKTAWVTIADKAFWAHYHGATIRPKEKEAMSIPLRAGAYGKYPRSKLIAGLFLLKTRRGAYLVTSRYQRGFGGIKRQRLTFWYKLVRKVELPRDPKALPSAGGMMAYLVQKLRNWVRSQLATEG